MEDGDAAAIAARAKAALAARVRAVLRLISPEHITPIGLRQIELALRDELASTAGDLNRSDPESVLPSITIGRPVTSAEVGDALDEDTDGDSGSAE